MQRSSEGVKLAKKVIILKILIANFRMNFLLGRMLSGPGWERTENERKVCQALEKVAAEVGAESIQAGR